MASFAFRSDRLKQHAIGFEHQNAFFIISAGIDQAVMTDRHTAVGGAWKHTTHWHSPVGNRGVGPGSRSGNDRFVTGYRI